ncbi:hypothetical protein CBUD_0190 [Coxiella burnetii Dugway 5J108-111]|uniref:Uncharacterized protein n=1 Tax=Coxiella burnetii (strain Dugway 5J108-111) TaxID=434922 RepID=A9KBH0_COXBN|nr:hypothetical protein CBUD_0190 [Coxiella burnetii Dugway 5J108-111]
MSMARKYSKAAQKEVQKEMRRYKKGKAHSGPKKKKEKSKKPKTSDSYRLVEGS